MSSEATRLEAAARELLAQNRAEEALAAAYRALAIRRKLLGDGHLDTWRTAELIADAHVRANQLDQAETALQFALSSRERVLGSGSAELARPLEQLAAIAVLRRNYPVAEQHRRRALSVLQSGLGPWHPDVAHGNIRLARLLLDLCRQGEAEPLLQQAVEILGRAFGATSPALAAAWEHLADAYWIGNDDARAESSLQKEIELLSPHEKDRASALVHALTRLARMYGDRQMSAEALAAGSRAVDVGSRAPGISDADRVGTAASLWELYRALGGPEGKDKLLARLAVVRVERARPGFVLPAPAPRASARCAPPASTAATAGHGSIPAASAVVSGMAPGFRRCYNEGLEADPRVAGTFRITARIDSSGGIEHTHTFVPAGSMVRVAECALDTVFSSKFSPPEGGGATVVIPVTFVSR